MSKEAMLSFGKAVAERILELDTENKILRENRDKVLAMKDRCTDCCELANAKTILQGDKDGER